MLKETAQPGEDSSPKDQEEMIGDLISRFQEISRTTEPFGLVQPEEYYYRNHRGLDEGFDEKAPYLHLAKAVETTLYCAADELMLEADIPGKKNRYEGIKAIVRNAVNGTNVMASVIELIPIKHLEQFPDEDPTPQELGAIARRSFSFLGRLSHEAADVAFPLVDIYFDAWTLDGQRGAGLLENWTIPNPPTRLAHFEFEETPQGRRLMPKDWNKIHERLKQRAHGTITDGKHCPAVEIKTHDGIPVLPAVWEVIISVAEKWHYIHTIRKMRENMPKK